jgi:tetratricopeptide (TPR) repeat protein
MRLDEYGEARARYEEARPIYHAIGDRLGEANCDLGLADVARDEEDWAQAERLCHAALGVYREIAMPFNVALALRRLGAVAEGKGERAEAIRSYQEALDIFAAIGVPLAEHTRADLERLQGSE